MKAVNQIGERALAMAARLEHPAILNHSRRVFGHAQIVANDQGLSVGRDYDVELLFVACILHDVGTVDRYDGPQRFEVEGADAAAAFLTAEGYPSAAVDQVWEAIALHTSAGIAERRGPITYLTRVGVLADFGRFEVPSEVRGELEAELPRLDIERVLGDAVVAQAARQPAKAPAATWPGGLYRAHLADPSAAGVNPAF